MIEDCTALILAGGESRRMGRDKASLPLHGKSLLEHVTATMRQVFSEVIISVRQPREGVMLRQVCDEVAESGPLAGLVAGLQQAETAWVFVVACDMPFVSAKLVQGLSELRGKHQAVVPMVAGHPQPLAAFYATSSLPAVRACLEGNGKRSLRELLEHLQVRYVGEAELRGIDPTLRSFVDLDTPQDVAIAMNQLGKS